MQQTLRQLNSSFPSSSESIDQATVTRWLKNVGEPVAEGELILEIATDQVDSEILAPFAGVVSEILVPEGEVAQASQTLDLIAPKAHAPSDDMQPPPAVVAPVATSSILLRDPMTSDSSADVFRQTRQSNSQKTTWICCTRSSCWGFTGVKIRDSSVDDFRALDIAH